MCPFRCGLQGPRSLRHQLLLAVMHISRKLGSGAELRLGPKHSNKDLSVPWSVFIREPSSVFPCSGSGMPWRSALANGTFCKWSNETTLAHFPWAGDICPCPLDCCSMWHFSIWEATHVALYVPTIGGVRETNLHPPAPARAHKHQPMSGPRLQ